MGGGGKNVKFEIFLKKKKKFTPPPSTFFWKKKARSMGGVYKIRKKISESKIPYAIEVFFFAKKGSMEGCKKFKKCNIRIIGGFFGKKKIKF